MFEWFLKLIWKVIGRKPIILPGSTDERIEVVIKDPYIQYDTLGFMVVQIGNESIKNSEEEIRVRKLELINSNVFKKYVSNIWIQISRKHSETRFILSPTEIGCEEKDYDAVVLLFKEALSQAGIPMEVSKPNTYWFFGEFGDHNHWSKTFEALWSKKDMEIPPQLTQGGPYR